jgi:valyl-tRNA synthetase
MKNTMKRLGFSIDWGNEYITMNPEYYTHTQISFVRMYEQGLIYREEHPVNWCPRCETAIAYAEVEYEKRKSTLHYIHFDKLDIATTRPELLCACVAIAVHPDDERFSYLIGEKVRVPLFEHEVEVIADEEVDPQFGTGAVMICTFGDKQDVRWWKEHSLPLRKAIGKDGKMTSLADKYEGMRVDECKQAVVWDLKRGGLLYHQEDVEQNVGICWRCKTPIEILSESQWFVKIDHEDVLKMAEEIEWIPEHMFIRLKNWIEGMEWDWCISRQRLFATPIPVWYCEKCGAVKVASEDELPVDPMTEKPKTPCEKCGSTEFRGEEDVLDTWMDSSISALYVGRWLDNGYLPLQLRPQGHDIIRTWAFYTILRSNALVGKRPWETIVINGMVLGEDGHKMSKSRGNYIQPEEVLEKYGADALRQWAAIGGATGSDIMFRWKDIVAASRFQQKLWSIARFCMLVGLNKEKPERLWVIDRWILSKLQKLVSVCVDEMDRYQFDTTLREIRRFCWNVFADNYIELVKGRLYGGDEEGKKAARYTLYIVLNTLTRLLAPFIPHITEEIYSKFEEGSVHLSPYPEPNENLIDEEAEKSGELIASITSAIRRYKAEQKIALNAPLKRIMIYANGDDIEKDDIAGTVNSEVVVLLEEPNIERVVKGFKPRMDVLGPMFREKARDIIKALEKLTPEELEKASKGERIKVSINSEEIILPPESIEVISDVVVGGEKVDVVDAEGAVVLIVR